MFAALAGRRVLFVVGKGGVGKSTVATALAVTLAAGLHTIQVQAAGTGGNSANATLSGDNTNVNQGTLSVLVIKQ